MTSSLFIGSPLDYGWITATYTGDANFTGSTSTALMHTVVTPFRFRLELVEKQPQLPVQGNTWTLRWLLFTLIYA